MERKGGDVEGSARTRLAQSVRNAVCSSVCVCVIGGEAAQNDSYGKYAMTTLKTKQHQLKFWWGLQWGEMLFTFY